MENLKSATGLKWQLYSTDVLYCFSTLLNSGYSVTSVFGMMHDHQKVLFLGDNQA